MDTYNQDSISSKKPFKRNLLIILSNMIQVIPNKSEENFRRDLEKQLEKASYTAPENMYSIWVNVQDIITERFKTCSDTSTLPDWAVLLVDIWTNRKSDV
jgi:hypothetical protein